MLPKRQKGSINLFLAWFDTMILKLMINFLLVSIRIKEQTFNYAENFGAQGQMRMWGPKRVDFQMNFTEVDQ